MKLTEKQTALHEFLKANGGKASMEAICEALNSDAKHLNPVVTTLGVKGPRAKGLVDYEKVTEDGKEVKYVFLTDAGMNFVPSEDEE